MSRFVSRFMVAAALSVTSSVLASDSDVHDQGGVITIPRQDILEMFGQSRPEADTAPGDAGLPGVVPLPELPALNDVDLVVRETASPGAAEEISQATGGGIWPAAGLAAGHGSEEDPVDRPGKDAKSSPASGTPSDENLGVVRGGEGVSWSLRDWWPLAMVLGLIGALALFMRKFMPARRLLGASDLLEVVSRMSLSSKQSLVLVRMGQRILLLGVTGDQINTLCLVEDPDQVAMIVGRAATRKPDSSTQAFDQAFRHEAGAYLGLTSDAYPEPTADATRGQVRGLLEKVRDISGRRNVA